MTMTNTVTINYSDGNSSILGLPLTDSRRVILRMSGGSTVSVKTQCISRQRLPIDMGLILSPQPYQLFRQTGTQEGYNISQFPSVVDSGVTVYDLASLDPNFPADEEPNWAYVGITSIVRNPPTDYFETEDTTAQVLVSGINQGQVQNFEFTNQVMYNSQIGEDQRQPAFFIPLNDKNQIAAGAVTRNITGSAVQVTVRVLGYIKSTSLGLTN